MAAALPPAGSPTSVPTIELASIRLRPITFDDVDFVVASAADPQVCRISSVPSPCTPAEARSFVERQHRRLPDGEGYPVVIEPREPDETVRSGAVGFIGVWFRELAKHGHLTFGYWSIEAARGNGYVAAALQGLSDWAFESIDCDRHRLWIEPWNVGSQRTGERAGFQPVAGVRDFEEIEGAQVEVLAWERTRPAP